MEQENQVIPSSLAQPRAFDEIPLDDRTNTLVPCAAQPGGSEQNARTRQKPTTAWAKVCQAITHLLTVCHGMKHTLDATIGWIQSILVNSLSTLGNIMQYLKSSLRVVLSAMSHLVVFIPEYLRDHFMEILGTMVALSFGAAMLYYARRTDDFLIDLHKLLEKYCICNTSAQPICVRFYPNNHVMMGCFAIKKPSWYFSGCVLENASMVWATLWMKSSLISIYGRLDLPAIEMSLAAMTAYIFLIGERRHRRLGWFLCAISGILLLTEWSGTVNPVFSPRLKAKCIRRVLDEFGNIDWTEKVDVYSLSHEGLGEIGTKLDALMLGEWEDQFKQLLARQE